MSIIKRIMGKSKDESDFIHRCKVIDCNREMGTWAEKHVSAVMLLEEFSKLLDGPKIKRDPGLHGSIEFDTKIDGLERVLVIFDLNTKAPISAEIVEDKDNDHNYN